MATGIYMSIITLNVNGLSAPTERHRLAEWKQKQDPHICSLQETHFRPKDTYRRKVRGWKNILYANEKQKKAGVSILVSDKTDLKIKITRDEHNDQGINPRGYITSVYIYAPNREAPQYIKH